jgi:lysyl-tRNA synthetase class 2
MGVEASIFSEFWRDQIESNGQEAIFLVLVGFLLSFGFIRMSTRLMRSPKVPWWPGSIVSEGGLHVHHHVFGIVLMMAAGAVGFAVNGDGTVFNLCGLAFGVGIGLTIDEFALWLHLEDVYWSEEGRRSIDATVLTAIVLALLMFGVRPFEIGSEDLATLIASLLIAFTILLTVGICFLKERVLHGFIGFFFWPLAIYGACRLGKPTSAWAKRRYGTKNPSKQRRAEKRFRPDRRTQRFKERVRDLIGGEITLSEAMSPDSQEPPDSDSDKPA